MACGDVITQGQVVSEGAAAEAAAPFIHPVEIVLDALVSAERQLNPALAKYLELRDQVEAMPVEELALLRTELAEAIEAGEAEAGRVKGALERLRQALPEPGAQVPLGF